MRQLLALREFWRSADKYLPVTLLLAHERLKHERGRGAAADGSGSEPQPAMGSWFAYSGCG